MFAEKNIKLLRPIVMSYTVTPEEDTHYFKLFFNTVSKGIAKINAPYEHPLTAEDAQQAQTNFPCGKSTKKLTRLVIKPIGGIKHARNGLCMFQRIDQ